MARLGSADWARLEQVAPSAFAIGGLGILGLGVAGALDQAAIVPSPGWLHAILMLGGIWFVFIGLVGFYPTVAQLAPRLSLAAVVTSALGWMALTVALVGAIVIDLTTQRTFEDPGSWAPPFLVGAFVLVLLSSLGYGIVSVRTNRPSRTIGFLLFVPFAALLGQAVLLISKIVAGDVLPVVQLSLAGIAGFAIIAIGVLLKIETSRTGRQVSADSVG